MSSHQPPQYNPVADYLAQRGPGVTAPDPDELRLLETLSKQEVDALVSIDNKAKQMTQPIKAAPGAVSF